MEKMQQKESFFKEIDHLYNENLDECEKMFKLTSKNITGTIIVSENTSSCGSLQIKNFNSYKGYDIPVLTKEEVSEFLEYIFEENPKINHYYFLDREDGYLERLLKEQGFTKVWSYLNYNSENIVNMWCLNRWTNEEVENKLE